MSTKIRIIELAKSYGLSGRDIATKLRENGFIQAKSHMSALDPIELLQARGLLAAVGITEPGAAAVSSTTDALFGDLTAPPFRGKIIIQANKPARTPRSDVLPPAANKPATDAEPEQIREKRGFTLCGTPAKGAYKDGKKEGLWTYYWGHGGKSAEGEYKDGKKVGTWTIWDDNGQKKSEGKCKDGKKEETFPIPSGMRERGDSPPIKIDGNWAVREMPVDAFSMSPPFLHLGKNHYFWDYHPRYGGLNPNHDQNSQEILGVKKFDPRCIKEFIDLLTPLVIWGPYPPGHWFDPVHRAHGVQLPQERSIRPVWKILTVPSHDPERETSGIRKIAFGIACAHATDTTPCLKRSKKTQPLHLGGERTVESQEASLTIVNDRLISGQHVLLLDDVTTSGCTMRAARKVIERSGALSVTTIALGKTV